MVGIESGILTDQPCSSGDFDRKYAGAFLSVISLVRRCSVIVTFAVGAVFFKEKNVRAKSFALAVLLCGMVLLLMGS